jgi:hypothetical protein
MQVAHEACSNGIVTRRRAVGGSGPCVQQTVEPLHGLLWSTHDKKCVGRCPQPGSHAVYRRLAIMRCDDIQDCRMIVRPRRLDREAGRVTRKEGLAYYRIADQVDQVGGAAPQFAHSRPTRMLAHMAPCLLTRAAMALRVRRFQFGSKRLADGILHGKTVALRGNERQRRQMSIQSVGVALR